MISTRAPMLTRWWARASATNSPSTMAWLSRGTTNGSMSTRRTVPTNRGALGSWTGSRGSQRQRPQDQRSSRSSQSLPTPAIGNASCIREPPQFASSTNLGSNSISQEDRTTKAPQCLVLSSTTGAIWTRSLRRFARMVQSFRLKVFYCRTGTQGLQGGLND